MTAIARTIRAVFVDLAPPVEPGMPIVLPATVAAWVVLVVLSWVAP